MHFLLQISVSKILYGSELIVQFTNGTVTDIRSFLLSEFSHFMELKLFLNVEIFSTDNLCLFSNLSVALASRSFSCDLIDVNPAFFDALNWK